jgi:ATP-dependent RNA helicase MSS116
MIFAKALRGVKVFEMHSRKSQTVRTRTAAQFRESKCAMMFSSDVSARGVDYPDVTAVVQVGLTDKEQYIHRLGRTARAGGKGEGVLILADFEQSLLRDLRGKDDFVCVLEHASWFCCMELDA